MCLQLKQQVHFYVFLGENIMSSSALKIIALICMIFDHTQVVFYQYTPIWFRLIGRLSFPIFAFLTAEGYKYSKNINRYLLRLFIFALISEIPYDIVFQNGTVFDLYNLEINYFSSSNVMFTLFLGVLSIYIYENLIKYNLNKFFSVIIIILFSYISYFISCDYGQFGVLLIFFIYISKNRMIKIFTMFIFFILKYWSIITEYITRLFDIKYFGYDVYADNYNLMIFIFTVFSLFFIYLYNGKRGFNLKWIFYLFYPVHLIILIFIYNLFILKV